MDFFSWNEEKSRPKITPKKWMKSKTMELATVGTLSRIIDECIENKLYGWDLETSGLNKQIYTLSFEEGRTQDQIVGHCLCPGNGKGYYIPIRHKRGKKHNLPLSLVQKELKRLVESGARAIFHNNWFDATFLQYNGGEPLGTWDDPDAWEDIWILAYLDNPKAGSEHISLGLKALSEVHLGYKQIELHELYPEDYTGKLDFSELDPSWDPCLWYAASDAICTYELFPILEDMVLRPNGHLGLGQSLVYKIEKLCAPATRWMEKVGIPIHKEKVVDLIRIGQREYYQSIKEVYEFCKDVVGRDIEPGWFKIFEKNLEIENVDFNITEQIDVSRKMEKKISYGGKQTIKKVIGGKERDFPRTYDILSRQQLGPLFEEMEIPDLKRTEKSGQVQTTQSEIDRLNQAFGDKYPFLPKISRMGELSKALGTYLFSLYKDVGPDGRLHCKIKQLGTETGRFTTPSPGKKIKNVREIGGTKYPLHGTPAGKDANKPECLRRIRETFKAGPGKCIVAIDYASVELRIVTNMSQEPKWLNEYFRCSQCATEFDRGSIPPTICPTCGSDKIGDLHTLTAIAFYGENKIGSKEWKRLRNDGKTSNFACVYGGGPAALQRTIGCDEHVAAHHHRVFTQTYDVLHAWQQKVIRYGQKHNFVTSAFGRHYPLKEINLPVSPAQEPDYDQRRQNKKIVSAAKRNAINAPVQMSSADVTKLAMGLVYQEIKKRNWFDKVAMIITIHDELVFEVDLDILAEFVSFIPGVMARNKAIQSLGWEIPLICDTEIGFDWTVPYNIIDWENSLVREDGMIMDWKGRATGKKWPMEFVRALAPKYGVQKIEQVPLKVKLTLQDLSSSNVNVLATILKENEYEEGSFIQIMSPEGALLHETENRLNLNGIKYDLDRYGISYEAEI